MHSPRCARASSGQRVILKAACNAAAKRYRDRLRRPCATRSATASRLCPRRASGGPRGRAGAAGRRRARDRLGGLESRRGKRLARRSRPSRRRIGCDRRPFFPAHTDARQRRTGARTALDQFQRAGRAPAARACHISPCRSPPTSWPRFSRQSPGAWATNLSFSGRAGARSRARLGFGREPTSVSPGPRRASFSVRGD